MGPLVEDDPNNRLIQGRWSVPNAYGIIQVDTDRRQEMGLNFVDPFINFTASPDQLDHLYRRLIYPEGVVKPVATIANLADDERRTMRFGSLYQVGDELVPMVRFVEAVFVESMGRELTPDDLTEIPMVDIFIGFPSYDDTLYFAGGIDTYGRKGRATILDRGMYSGTWLNSESSFSLTGRYGNLLIAPLVDDRAGAFTVEGVLDLRGLVGEDPRVLNYTLIDNSVTAIVGVAPLEETTYLLADSYLNNNTYDYGQGSRSYGGPITMGGSRFGRMGRSVASNQRVQRAEAPKNINSFAIFNFHPVVINGLADMRVLLPSHLR